MNQLHITNLSLITKRSLFFFLIKFLENLNKNNQQITKPTTVQLQIDRVIIIIIGVITKIFSKKSVKRTREKIQNWHKPFSHNTASKEYQDTRLLFMTHNPYQDILPISNTWYSIKASKKINTWYIVSNEIWKKRKERVMKAFEKNNILFFCTKAN